MLPPLSDLHRIECWLLHHGLHLKSDPPAGAAPAWSPLREECIARLCHGGIEKWRSREDLHLEPPPSQGGMQDSVTPRERISPAGVAPASRASETRILSAELRGWKSGAPCRCCPGARLAHPPTSTIPFRLLGGLEDRRAAVTPMTQNGGCCRNRAGLSSSSGRR